MTGRAAAATLCVAAAACHQSVYVPARSPRVVAGRHAYYRDGVVYPAGFFGCGLVHAVEGNRRSEELARSARRRKIAGFVTSMVAGTCAGFAFGNLGAHEREAADPSMALSAVALGCGVGWAIGLTLLLQTTALERDAINIYNDESADPMAGYRSVPWTLSARALVPPHGGAPLDETFYVLVEGAMSAANAGELQAALRSRPDARSLLLGGKDAAQPAEFKVLLGKRYTLCAYATLAATPAPVEPHDIPVTCREIQPPAGNVVLKVILPTPIRAPGARPGAGTP